MKDKGNIPSDIKSNVGNASFTVVSRFFPVTCICTPAEGCCLEFVRQEAEIFFSNPSKNKIMTYSIKAMNTWPKQITRNTSMALSFLDVGADPFAPLKILISTKNRVTSNPIRPGTTLGLIRNDAHDTMTNNVEVRYT